MSWSFTYTVDNAQTTDDLTESNIEGVAHHEDQWAKAVYAAEYLISSGVLGDPNGKYRVVLSGHGNENHEPAPGWSNDFISIQVMQLDT